MAWIYLAELEGYRKAYKPMQHQLLIVKETDSANRCCCQESVLGNSLERQSGMTLHRLLAPCYQVSISFMAGSPVRTSLTLELEKVWEESEAFFFTKLCAFPKKRSPNSYSLKTCQPSEHTDWIELCGNLPNSGMTVDGVLYPLQRLGEVISARGGSFLPTPTACDYGKNQGRKGKKLYRERWSLTCLAARGNLKGHPKGSLSPEFVEQMMGMNSGATDLELWGIQWFRSRPKKLLKS